MKNRSLDDQLVNEGFVVMDLLDDTVVEKLSNFYRNAQSTDVNVGFHSTHFLKDRAYKRKEAAFIKRIFQEIVNAHFDDYHVCFSSYMLKKSGPNSTMSLHADWTYVNEEEHVSLAIWCPLIDTSEKNGCIGVVPQSHRILHSVRGPQIPSSFHDYNEYIIENFGKLIPMKAGQALVYDHRLLHYSPPNTSEDDRLAINISMVPKGTELYHFTGSPPSSKIIRYKVQSNDFFIEYDHFEKPDLGEDFRELDNPNVKVTKAQLDHFYGKIDDNKRRGKKYFWTKIRDLF